MTKTRTNPALLAAGLTEREAAVWSALADWGPMNVSEIARHADLHRPGVYAALETLGNKKLIAPMKGARVSYRATGAGMLMKLRAANDKALAPKLEKLLREERGAAMPEDVRVYRGADIRKVWEELASLPKGTVFYRYDGYAPGTKIGSYVPETYRTAIGNRHLERFVITNKGLRASPFKKRVECASRMLPGAFDAFEQGVSHFVFGDRIALIDFTTETAVIIRNPALASYHARLFQFLFRTLKE